MLYGNYLTAKSLMVRSFCVIALPSVILAVNLLAGGPAFVAAAITGNPPPSTWNIVQHISGVRTQVPTHAPANNFPDGALLGNGSLGVAIQGRNTDHISLFLGREDFWSLFRGRIMPFGRVVLSIPALHDGSYKTVERIGRAEVTGHFTSHDGHALRFKAWVAKPQNLLVVKLRNAGQGTLKISSALLDGWGTPGSKGMGGNTGGISWLKVSPDTVQARIGQPTGRENSKHFSGSIENLRIYASAAPRHTAKPRFSFLIQRSDSKSAAAGPTSFDCGFLRLPQRAFDIQTSVNPKSAAGTQAIFSAMTTKRWTHWPGGGQPRIPYGFSLSLANGKVTAMLNRVRIIDPQPLPLNAWSQLAVRYNGRSLGLYVGGKLVATSRAFPTTAQVAGPVWDWNAIHPGDSQLAFDGCGPKGLLAVRIIGQIARVNKGVGTISLGAGESATVLISALDDHDTLHYRAATLRLLGQMRLESLSVLRHKELMWWKHFWNKSTVEIPDKRIEAFYYGSLYLFACCSAPGHIAPGLWGNFITSPWMAWNGDYTLDYNYEAPCWAAYPTNHIGLADNYDLPLLAWMARGRGLAKLRGFKGLYYHCHLSPPPGWSADGARALQQKSDALFGAVDCLMRWRYTRSPQYARMIYPFLRGTAAFWDHYLVLKNGVYVDENDAADELSHAHDENPATSIAFLRMLYAGLLDMNRTLQLRDPAATTWRRILRHLAPLPIFPAAKVFGPAGMHNKLVIRYTQKGTAWSGPVIRSHWGHPGWHGIHGSSAGMNPSQAIFPGWAIGLESSPRLLKAGLNTVQIFQIWYDYNNDSSYYPAAACVGYNPDKILHHLHTLIDHCSYPNFVFQMGGGGTENFAIVPTTICAMFLQSYQHDIHIFPDWPRNQDAAFRNLLACGDFLVSSRLKAGQIDFVNIVSQRGGICRVANPWPGKSVLVRLNNGPTRQISGKVLQWTTRKGSMLRLRAQ